MFVPALTIVIGKLLSGKFVLNRLMGGTGSAYLYRKGKQTGLKRYYAAAVGVYVLSWALLLVSFGLVVEKIIKWLAV